MAIKSWPKLIISILLSQSAGFVGTFFTISAIPTWYATLNRPSFSPPNWVFGPVWTILYTLIGISLYKIWIKKGDLKLFFFHLFLNAIWSPVFFGLKNLDLAFLIILIMDVSLIVIIKRFIKIDKIAGFLLIPYLLWISFASILNFSIWQLNPNDTFAQDFVAEDAYRNNLSDFSLKKASYLKNPTLSLKEELRASFYKFLGSRNDYVKSYLNLVKTKSSENIYSKIDPEINWFDSRKNSYDETNTLENLLEKSIEEDTRYKETTLPVIYFSLANISLNNVKGLKESHIKIYNNLKNESENLVKLGRADQNLFKRWFDDIDNELKNISTIEINTQSKIDLILGADDYQRDGAYKKAMEELDPVKLSLLKLNGFIKEFDNVLESKR